MRNQQRLQLLRQSLTSAVVVSSLFCPFAGFSQVFDQVTPLGGVGHDYVYDIVVDDAGNVYTAGLFSGTVDFDPGTANFPLTATGQTDGFVKKTAPDGTFLWAAKAGGGGSDETRSLAVDANGNVYAVGHFRYAVDFDPGPAHHWMVPEGATDGYLWKLSPDGQFIDAWSIGGNSYDYAENVAVDAMGYVYVGGTFRETADFDPGGGSYPITSAGGSDAFIQKTDGQGNLAWAGALGGSAHDRLSGLGVDGQGSIYVCGSFRGSANLSPAGTPHIVTAQGQDDLFLTRINSGGQHAWSATIGGAATDFANDLIVSKDGLVYVVGQISDVVDVDPSAGVDHKGQVGATNAVVLQFDASGRSAWSQVTNASNYADAMGVTIDAFDRVVVTGNFTDQTAFQAGTSSILNAIAGGDAYLWTIFSDGIALDARAVGSTGEVHAQAIASNSGGDVYVAGAFNQDTDFDPGPGINVAGATGLFDGFDMKLSHCEVDGPVERAVYCGPMTYFGHTYTESGIYRRVLRTESGCDSTMLLELTIPEIQTDVSIMRESLKADLLGASFYQWVDCNQNYAPISGATGRIFTPVVPGNYAVIIYDQGCEDTSACFAMNSVGIADQANAIEVLASPNPTSGMVQLTLPDGAFDRGQCEVYTTDGKRVQAQALTGTRTLTLQLDEPAGLYIVRLTDEAGASAMVRVMKQ